MLKLKRNPSLVLSQLVENQAGQVLCKVPCKIQVPFRFSERGLGEVSVRTFAYGLFPIILETGDYAIINVCALIELNPYKVLITTIDEVDYHEFYFEANQVVINSGDLVKVTDNIYNILDELVFKGKVPWYVEYEDLAKLFDTAKDYADSNVGQSPEVMEFIAAMVTRSKDDRSKYIREVMKTKADAALNKIEYVALSSIFYSVKSTVNKIAGSYFSDGVISALVNPSEKAEKIERILRA